MSIKKFPAAYVLFFILGGVLLSCVGNQGPRSNLFLATPQKIDRVKVSLKLIEPASGEYYLWDSMLQGKKEKVLTWKDAKDLSPRQLFFIKDGFSLEGKKYPGGLMLSKDYKHRIRLLNSISMELYLKGVVPSEMPYRWPAEALKAQAIVARTYASYDFQNSIGFVESSVMDQVYGGQQNLRPSTNHAVEATRGKILTYNGQIFPAYFHSTSGGITTTIPYVWPRRKNFDVVEVIKDKYSVSNPHQDWQTKLSPMEIEALLAKKGHQFGRIQSLQVVERDPSGRVHKIKVIGTRDTKVFQGNDFRLILGWKNLKSTLFELKSNSGEFIFVGHGFGHGVGFSQWGAKVMAEKGFNYKQILEYYFPKAQIK